jgi:hypothetical protein
MLSLRIGSYDLNPDQIVAFGNDRVFTNCPSLPFIMLTAAERKTHYNQWIALCRERMTSHSPATPPGSGPRATRRTTKGRSTTAQATGGAGGN